MHGEGEEGGEVANGGEEVVHEWAARWDAGAHACWAVRVEVVN